MGAFDDLIPAGDDPFADLVGDQPGDKIMRAGGFTASAKQSVGSLIKGAGQIGADFIPGVSQDNSVSQYGQHVIDDNPTAVHSLSDIADKPLTAAKEAVGNAGASMAGIVGSRLLGQGITAAAPLAGPAAPIVAGVGQGISLLGPYAVAALPSFGSIRDQQGSDASIGAKAAAAAGAATVGIIENKFGPQEWALSALTKGGRDQLAEKFAAKTLTGSVAKGIGTGAAIEGGEELVQNPVEQLAAFQDPRTPENVADTVFSGAMGAIGGGIVGGPMAGLSHRQPQAVIVPRADGQGDVAIDPSVGPLSAAVAEHVHRGEAQAAEAATGDLFGDMAPIEQALAPVEHAAPIERFADLKPEHEPSQLDAWLQEAEPVSLQEAQAVVQQAKDAGYYGHMVVQHGQGYTAVPREWLTADRVKAAEMLQPSTNDLLNREQISGQSGALFDDLLPAQTPVDQAAQQTNTAPSEAQKAAGNYQKGHIKVGPLDIAIENPAGSTRAGPGWQTTMHAHYGYMKRTEGADGDQVDVYVKAGTPGDHQGPVFVVNQFDPATGQFDEHKAMIGYRFKGAAVRAYDQHFGDGSGPQRRQGVVKMSAEQFKDWAQNGDTKGPATSTLRMAHAPVPNAAPKEQTTKQAAATIQDFGQKIGSARKDIAQPPGPKSKAAIAPVVEEPGWQRRFKPLQNMLRNDPTWSLLDTKTGKPVRGAEFKSEQAAKDAIPMIAVAQKHRVVSVKDGFEIMRDVTDKKRIKVVDQVFPTRDAAMAYMAQHAAGIVETKTSFREELFARPEKVMRDGAQRRTSPATAEDFSRTFGFRGVEFGLWNNQDERQEVMNHAYDGLLDLAEVLDVPAKALSLNGDLALAFGARGQGLSGAVAHYERGHAVINLTKMQGAGALAHEWFHAADHYFGRQDGKASSEKAQNKRGDQVYVTNGPSDYASHGLSLKSGMREEVRAKYKALIQTMFTKAERYVEDTAQAERFVGSSRNALVKSLTGMRQSIEKASPFGKRNNKPATAEQLAEFDRLADQVIQGQAFELETRSSQPKRGQRFGSIRLSNDVLDALSDLYKAVRGRSGMNAERTGLVDGIRGDMRRYADRVKMLDDARSANEKTKSVPTRYAMDAKRIDQGSATEYWTTPYEMAARAFSAYVEDKISEESGRSDFLSYGSNNSMPQYRIFNVRPFPEGAERAAINQGFDQLFETLQTRETEKGVQLFNQTGRTKKATSLDRDVFGLAAAGSPSARILSSIAEASNDPYRRELAKLLQAKGIAPAVTVSDGDGQHAAAYDPRSNTVALFAEADAERHFLHEAIHAATLSALNNKGLVAGQMKALHKHVVEQLGADSHYGMSNLDEFVAEAFTNARFQAELRRLPAAPGSTLASSWHWFVRTVRQLLGLDAKHDSALSQALQLGVSLMDEVSNRTAVDRSAHGAELKALRRAAARLERPEDGITFRVTDDGLAIAIGPKGKIVPPRFAKFARENGLTYQVRRLPVAAGTEAPAMPETYRESGAKYFGELASDNRPIDRTGKTRFNVQRLAPNGKPSNLNEKQWHQVRTLAFKAWFGDWQNDPAKASQVVDENGEPLVVYHGTTNGGMFTEFKPNDRGLIWAASQRETAASYAGSDREVDLGGKERQRGVLPVFLNIRNPSEIKADGKSYVDLTQFDGEDFTDWFAMQAKKAGRDGAIIRDVIDDGGEGAHEIKTAGDNYVVFGSAQVKSAMQNVGSFDLSNPDVRFSATDERLTVRDWLTHQLANQRSWALGALTRDQLADIYGREMPEVAEFDRVVQQMDQARNIVAEQADALVERWRKLPGKVADTLADLMHTATLEQFDPDLKTRDDVHTPEQSMLLKEWGNLSPEAQQLYRDVREQYRATLVKLRNGLAKRAETQSAAAIRLEFDKYLAEGPYFPLARFGDFILIAAKFGQRIVEAFESSASREKRARGLRAQGWTTKLTAKKDYSAASDGPSGEFVGKVLVLVGGMDIETKEKSALMDSLNQLAISALPDQSYRRHFSHRKGTPGFSQDAMRAFASSMQHVSHHVARVLHGDELQILVDGLNKRTKEATGDVDTTAMQQVANELAKRLDLMLNPTTHPVTAALGQVGFVMSLGGSVASGLTNLSQTPLVTYPWLGARFGFGKAAAALTRASKDYFAGRWDRWSGFVLKDSNSLSADERSALTELEDAGLINLTQAHDLAGTANTDSANSSRSFAINRAMKLVGWTFHVPEVMNRQVSALAAYRLARDKGQDHQAAIETAREAVRATHFDYSGSNRARWMAGNFTRTVTMFKQYSQNVTYLLWRQTYQALKGESPEVRREARRMLLGVAATHFAAAGTLGLPLGVFGVTPLLGLLAMGMGSEDEPWDWQVEFRNLLADLFGKQAGEAIAHGPLRTLTGIDMAGRVGLGDLWIRAPLAEKEGRDLVEAWMLTLLGPVAGYAGNIGTAMKAFDEGKVGRGFEAMLPKFIAAPIKAARYESDGVKSWRGDDLGVQLDGGDIFATALGFQPSQLAQMFEGQRAIKGRESQLMARREEISNMFTSAALAGDSEMQAESMKAAMAFSLRNPSMALTADSLRRSLQAKVRNQAMIKDGVYLSKKRQDLRAEGRFAVTD